MSRLMVIAAALLFVACHRPPLRVTQHGTAFTVDVQTLGEYPTDVARLRLTDSSNGHVVWELKGHDDPQMGTFELNIGENSVNVRDVRHGAYVVVTPVGTPTFVLTGGNTYVIEIWSRSGDALTKRQTKFTVPRQQ